MTLASDTADNKRNPYTRLNNYLKWKTGSADIDLFPEEWSHEISELKHDVWLQRQIDLLTKETVDFIMAEGSVEKYQSITSHDWQDSADLEDFLAGFSVRTAGGDA